MRILIGIDDTDTKETRGTGFHSREIAKLIEKNKMGFVEGITRHQLLLNPQIPYTSANSSACLEIECMNLENIKYLCLDYLNRVAPKGADVGLCIAEINTVNKDIVEWGKRAKKEVLTQDEGWKIAKMNGTYLKGLSGTEDGIIGALAAVGLRKYGNDGRFLWLRGKKELREIPNGIYSIKQLKKDLYLDDVISKDRKGINETSLILIEDWVRPLHQNHKKILIVEKVLNTLDYEWKIAPKEYIKSIS